MAATKKCPFCGEDILSVAIKCKHCGSNLMAATAPVAEIAQRADYGTIMLVIPIVASFLILFWVGSMNLLEGPMSKLQLIMIATILSTAILAAMEVKKNAGNVLPGKKAAAGPVGWFFSLLVFWILCYPAYMHHRKVYGLEGRLALSILVAVICLAVSVLMGGFIESQQAELRQILR